MAETDFKAQVDTLIKTQILLALKSAPEAIDAMVEAALKQDVNEYGGKPDGYRDKPVPYLTWLVGNEIRQHARDAVKAAIADHKDAIHAAVKRAVTADKLVDGLVKKILAAVDQDYRVNIKFADEESRR